MLRNILVLVNFVGYRYYFLSIMKNLWLIYLNMLFCKVRVNLLIFLIYNNLLVVKLNLVI